MCVWCRGGRGKKLTRNFATYLSYIYHIYMIIIIVIAEYVWNVRNEECFFFEQYISIYIDGSLWSHLE